MMHASKGSTRRPLLSCPVVFADKHTFKVPSITIDAVVMKGHNDQETDMTLRLCLRQITQRHSDTDIDRLCDSRLFTLLSKR